MSRLKLTFPKPPIETLPVEKVANGGAFQTGSYSSGANWSVKIDRIGHLKRLFLRIAGSVATGGTPGTPTARIRNPILLAGSRLSLKVNGKEEMSGHPDLLLFRGQWRRGRYLIERDAVTTAELANANTSYDFAQVIPFDFCPPGVDPAHIGLLNAARTPDIELSGTWGAIAAMMTSAGATQAVNPAALAVMLERCYPRLTKEQLLGFGSYILEQFGAPVSSTGVFNLEIPGGRAYQALFIRAEAGSTPEPSDSVLTSTGTLRVRKGSEVVYETPIANLLRETETGMPTSGVRTGLYAVDFTKPELSERAVFTRGRITAGGQPLRVEIDATTSTGARIDVMTEQFRSPADTAQGRFAASSR